MEIQAAHRLKASNPVVLTKLGLEGEVLNRDEKSSLFELNDDDADEVVEIITHKLGRPRESKSTTQLIYVWNVSDTMGLALYVSKSDGRMRLEAYYKAGEIWTNK